MYYSQAHSKFNIKFHVIFVVKYRKKLLTGNIDKDIKILCLEVAKNSDFSIDIMETELDHIHLLINSVPKLSPLMIVRKLKQGTTVGLWKRHSRLLQSQFWLEKTFWSDGYFVCSCGDASTETIRKYIETQG